MNWTFRLFYSQMVDMGHQDDGCTWTGDYFRATIIEKNVFLFLKNKENVIEPSEVTFLHDRAPCYKASATQELLKASNVDFFSTSEYPGNSPDLNATENFGAIIKDRVDILMEQEDVADKFKKETLLKNLKKTLRSLRNARDIFRSLLASYPERISAVAIANGGHTRFK